MKNRSRVAGSGCGLQSDEIQKLVGLVLPWCFLPPWLGEGGKRGRGKGWRWTEERGRPIIAKSPDTTPCPIGTPPEGG